MDQLERHCLAPDGSLFSKSTYYDVQLIENSEKKVLMGKQRAVSRWPRAVLAADASAEVISKFHFKSMKNI
ncbi:AUGMIN subunit [Sesamum angolense]|uniref:AUGMIN subunit n=1 Tax=Sesamum angolense TaxID=2727404 RepID=A0AAE2BK04_9LAMI|nr:AUGMIN subunit [Sesamum angolense]